jgi:hypothetical protein
MNPTTLFSRPFGSSEQKSTLSTSAGADPTDHANRALPLRASTAEIRVSTKSGILLSKRRSSAKLAAYNRPKKPTVFIASATINGKGAPQMRFSARDRSESSEARKAPYPSMVLRAVESRVQYDVESAFSTKNYECQRLLK